MVYTEIKNVNGNRYYYRVRSVRDGRIVKKERKYLGVNLSKGSLLKKEKEADKELKVLGAILLPAEIRFLENLKKEHAQQPKETYDNRYESFCALFTYDSNAIEGNTLTLQQTSQLLFENIVPSSKSLREINEALNHKKAFDYILGFRGDISKNLVLELHRLVIRDTLRQELSAQVGKFRTVQVYIRGVEWLPPKPKDVPREIAALLSRYTKNKNKLHPIVVAAYFHTGFEIIHPFVDGNGRVGRLLMNYILHKSGYPMINIPSAIRHRYYSALETAQISGDLRPFVELMLDIYKNQKIKF